ncbi:unnamed protein product [Rotaria sp. Silwood2]|nr:unnamed protein product [Rotaria sp. Silwood2]CAF4566677.1 unnamed protein product [Rotaria sp. Silwood2]CAF4697455.1 unnamed protein product [Rotaria sp. Silwood2]
MCYCIAKLIFVALLFCSFVSVSKQQYTPDWTSLDARPLPRWMWWYWQGTNPHEDIVAYMKKNYPPDWTYANFGPQFRADLYDPNEWADLFAASGAKYVVLTSKHHEGYAMWPSTFNFNWNSMHVGPKRNLLGDLAAAIRNRTKLVFGLYYSLFEWFNPIYLQDKSNNFTTQYFPETKALPELRELVETYKPEIVWSDGEWQAPDTYWKASQFLAWLYNESPVKDTVVVNDRWGRDTPCKHGDFYTCADRYNPGYLIEHKWENAFTIDKISWGYRPTANIQDYMTIEEMLKEVVITISTGGNALINVGPNMHGKIPPVFQERLRQMGSWLQVNGEAIYATKPWKYQNDTINSNVWYTSSKDNKFVYAFLLIWPKDSTEIILGAPLSSSRTIVTLLGSSADSVSWHVTSGDRGIVIDVSAIKLHLLQSEWTWTFKLENLLPDDSFNSTPSSDWTSTSTTSTSANIWYSTNLLWTCTQVLCTILAVLSTSVLSTSL